MPRSFTISGRIAVFTRRMKNLPSQSRVLHSIESPPSIPSIMCIVLYSILLWPIDHAVYI